MWKYSLLILISSVCYGQTGWNLLATTEIKKSHDPFLNEAIDLPLFPDVLRKMEGSEITLDGFVIPLQQDASQSYFVLSRYPFQSCFFCGGAGPETVIEVYSEEELKYTDEQVRVTGTLFLNPDDPLRLFFILKNCQVISL